LYKVIKHFTDMQDNNFAYDPTDPSRNTYPRKGLSVLPSRIKELAGSKNRQGCPLIEEIPDVEEAPEKKTKSTKKVDKE
jgi:hypothetical protein